MSPRSLPSAARQEQWSGLLLSRPGALALTGSLGSAAAHAHAAVQVLVCTRGTVVLDDGRHQAAVRAAVIPAGVRHAVSIAAGECEPPEGWSLYVDTDSAAGQALHWSATAEADAGTAGAKPAPVLRWAAAAQRLSCAGASAAAALAVVDRLRCPSPSIRHPALSAALSLLPGALADEGPVRITEIAERVGISASRLGHLFTEQLGLPFPAWIRWARLRSAMDAARSGANLTEAAHAAGFADSAHLTRTFRAMFGVTPSQALGHTHWENRCSHP